MKEIFLKILKYLFYTIFGAVFIFVLVELLDVVDGGLFNFTKQLLSKDTTSEVKNMTVLKVVYPDEPIKLEPTLADPSSRQRLDNIYEELVKTDRDLKIKPGLAVSWGLLSDLTWEFRLRPDVKFHDGSTFDAIDVKASLERAETFPGSEVVGNVGTIDKIEIVDDLTFKITTLEPDPLLLQKLATILILPSEYQNEELNAPIGTASYKFESLDKGDKIVITRFYDYWGEKSKFEKIEMFSEVDKVSRLDMLINGLVDFVAFVPYDGVEYVQEAEFNLVMVPSLEVQFLVFNMKSPLMNILDNRKVVSLAIDQEALVSAVGGYARKSNQFVSTGILGFSPKIAEHYYDLKESEKLAETTQLKGKTIQFHLMRGLTVLGDYVRDQLGKVGVNVVVSYLDGAELFASMAEGKADLYFLGFKSEMGEALPFLHSIVHSVGLYSYWGYENEYVDKLLDGVMVEMDLTTRQKNMQEAMKVLVNDDYFGVPLFEYETIYAFNDKIDVNPRIDGIIHFDELTIK